LHCTAGRNLLIAHYRMQPSRSNAGRRTRTCHRKPHRHLKRAFADRLLLRGSPDFEDLAAYRHFIDEVIGRRNAAKRKRIEFECASQIVPSTHQRP
jgi:hypothetical protein